MEDVRLSKFIDDPHQKFYYIYNFDRPYEFHVELIKILKEEEGKVYPLVSKRIGEAPKSAAASNFPLTTGLEDIDDDDEVTIDETEYGVDDDELDMFDEDDDTNDNDEDKQETNGMEDEYLIALEKG